MARAKHPKHFFCDLYTRNFYFYVGWPREEFRKYMKKYYDYEPSAHGHGCTVAADTPKGIIIHIWTLKKTDYSSLAHECVHAANYCLETIGWQPQLDNDEPQAYLVGCLMTQALRK